jgi:hypothetical protein
MKAGIGRPIKNALCVISAGVIDARAAARRRGGFLQPGVSSGKAHVGESQENEPEHRLRILRGFKFGIGAELVGCGPERVPTRLL